MIGRAPMMAPPPGSMPMFSPAPAPAMNMPPPMGMAQPPMGMPVNPQAMAPASPPAQPGLAASRPPASAPTFRGQAAEEPSPRAPEPPVEVAPQPLAIPSPEQLGVASARGSDPTAMDWTAAHHRLDQLGALSFHEERIAGGGCRFICVLPTAQPNRTHRIEAQAASEAEAVRLTLEKAEAWVRQR